MDDGPSRNSDTAHGEPSGNPLVQGLPIPRGEVSQRDFAELAFLHGLVGIIITDPEHRILVANPAFSAITGYDGQEVIGWDISVFHSREQKPEYHEQCQHLDLKHRWQGEVLCRRKNGEYYPELLIINAVHDAQGRLTHYVRAFIDISTLKANESQLRLKAHYDPLTGLANRLLLNDRLAHAMRRAKRHDRRFALLFIDLDCFKRINDSLGHAAGDQLLKQTARRLSRVLRSDDTLARFGGDEFVALLEHDVSSASAQNVAIRLLEALEPPFWIAGQHLPVSGSIGIALYPQDSDDIDELIHHADAAMYAAKRAGHGRYAFVDKALSRDMQAQLTREIALREALGAPDRHFRLLYQPQIDLQTGRPVGLEALVRWHPPSQEPLLPRQFLPLARSLGLAVRLDRWVLGQVIRQHQHWLMNDSPLAKLPIAVNIVDQHLLEDAFDHQPLDRFLREHAEDASWLTLEIASDSLAGEPEELQHLLRRLQRLGVKLAIDELGDGYVNFAYLSRLPIRQAKLNGALVASVARQERSQKLIGGIHHLLASLGVDCIVVGVENQPTATALIAQGVTRSQGNHFAAPMTAADLAGWYQTQQD
ncbi:putative bifunctional diguanylate cyclase/phosphodiesterase [Litchfieldella rifensis]|uniref:Bifunctional diguanylate cyclase/phosphodiesterase n=1 Tax=Litchfieldella rifensis TaxID=762643 RepID=A0ABV7LJD5_9GAMM